MAARIPTRSSASASARRSTTSPRRTSARLFSCTPVEACTRRAARDTHDLRGRAPLLLSLSPSDKCPLPRASEALQRLNNAREQCAAHAQYCNVSRRAAHATRRWDAAADAADGWGAARPAAAARGAARRAERAHARRAASWRAAAAESSSDEEDGAAAAAAARSRSAKRARRGGSDGDDARSGSDGDDVRSDGDDSREDPRERFEREYAKKCAANARRRRPAAGGPVDWRAADWGRHGRAYDDDDSDSSGEDDDEPASCAGAAHAPEAEPLGLEAEPSWKRTRLTGSAPAQRAHDAIAGHGCSAAELHESCHRCGATGVPASRLGVVARPMCDACFDRACAPSQWPAIGECAHCARLSEFFPGPTTRTCEPCFLDRCRRMETGAG